MSPVPVMPEVFHLYDTTLRDGAQQEGIALTVEDKLRIAGYLDQLGVTFIEGGWPGANPSDTEFFARARTELQLRNAELVAFGATRKAGVKVEEDPQIQGLLDAGTRYICVVAKSHDAHVTEALRTTLEENLAMVSETVAYLVSQRRRVFVDCEHFFDGFDANPAYALEAVTVHGAWRGTGLALRRLGRCHPWSLGGYDPVPGTAAAQAWAAEQAGAVPHEFHSSTEHRGAT